MIQNLIVALAAALVLSAQSERSNPQYYNEIYDEAGRVRPQYQNIEPIWRAMTDVEKEKFRTISNREFMGDNPLSPLPRLSTEAEYWEVGAGIAQRGLAISMFLRDHYSGKKSYLQKAIVRNGRAQSVIPQNIIERISKRAGVAGFEGMIDPGRVGFPNFPYGPDITRDAGGIYRAYEDNTGFLGGFGDLLQSRETLLRHFPAYKSAIESTSDPKELYEALSREFKARANGGAVVLLSLPTTMQADNEEKRLRKIFSDLGIDFVSTGTKRKLIVKPDAVYIRYPDGRESKVGFIIMSGEHADLDLDARPNMEKAILQTARDVLEDYRLMLKPTADGLKGEELAFWRWAQKQEKSEMRRFVERLEFALNQQVNGSYDYDLLELTMKNESQVNYGLAEQQKNLVRGLTQAMMDGRVHSNFSPGLEMVDDKEFYLFVEDLIRFYLKEEPIIRNIEGGSFADPESGRLIEDALAKVRRSPADWVIKAVTGRGGDGVFIGAKLSRVEFQEALKRVEANPADYKFERYTHPLVHGGDIGDSRRFTQFLNNEIIMSPVDWARGSPVSGSGKVNISANGHVVASFVVPDPPQNQCQKTVGMQFKERFNHYRNLLKKL